MNPVWILFTILCGTTYGNNLASLTRTRSSVCHAAAFTDPGQRVLVASMRSGTCDTTGWTLALKKGGGRPHQLSRG
jgi:hypothetical protein